MKDSNNSAENISLKFKDNGDSVQDALQSLTNSIADFNHEAGVCAQLRMGRMEHTVDSTSIKVTGTLQPN